MMTISDEAVEAASKAVFLTGYPEGCGVSWDPKNPSVQAIMRDIRVALEAAAPYMRQSAGPEREVFRKDLLGKWKQ